MCDDDQFSFSLISTTGVETVYTPTEQGTDEFEFVDGENAVWEASSGGSTSLTPSVYSHEYEFGRRYHGFKSGRYPLPNDLGEQQREETKHALMLELTVGICLTEVEAEVDLSPRMENLSCLILEIIRRKSSILEQE